MISIPVFVMELEGAMTAMERAKMKGLAKIAGAARGRGFVRFAKAWVTRHGSSIIPGCSVIELRNRREEQHEESVALGENSDDRALLRGIFSCRIRGGFVS